MRVHICLMLLKRVYNFGMITNKLDTLVDMKIGTHLFSLSMVNIELTTNDLPSDNVYNWKDMREI